MLEIRPESLFNLTTSRLMAPICSQFIILIENEVAHTTPYEAAENNRHPH